MRLSNKAVAAQFLEVFKASLDEFLSNLVYGKAPAPKAGVWNRLVFKIPSYPDNSMIL